MIDFNDLDDLDSARVVQPKHVETFPCQKCGGTGRFLGRRVRQQADQCFACGGRGYFKTSPQARAKARGRAAQKKIDQRRAFQEKHGALLGKLSSMREWSEFARKLMDGFAQYGSLTEAQLAAAQRMVDKVEERRRERETTKSEPVATRLSTLAHTFLSAAESLKFPKLRLQAEDGQEVALTRCGSSSRTPGWINVTDGRPYGENMFFGRISPEGDADIKRSAPVSVLAVLKAYDADPKAEAKVQGQRTGRCMCCGRELTDPVSIDLGIGPICANKWGI